jgi:isoaspartyl peptidase/L-asparaginase-like protein (Ntn-hydrolase superfamily)
VQVGALATGFGEAILRVGLSGLGCRYVNEGMQPMQACELAIADCKRLTGQNAGLIMLSVDGEIGFSHTTPRMARAYVKDGKIVGEV